MRDLRDGQHGVVRTCEWSWTRGFLSYTQPPLRRGHGCTAGIDRDPPAKCLHPGRMVGHTRSPPLACVDCVVVHVVAHDGVRWRLLYRQSCLSARTLPRTTPCGGDVGGPCRLHPSARTHHCTAVAAGTALVWGFGF